MYEINTWGRVLQEKRNYLDYGIIHEREQI